MPPQEKGDVFPENVLWLFFGGERSLAVFRGLLVANPRQPLSKPLINGEAHKSIVFCFLTI